MQKNYKLFYISKLTFPFFVAGLIFMFSTSCDSSKSADEKQKKEILESTTVPQEWDLAFDRITYSFGTIKESDGIVSTDFTFVNRGKNPIVISDVRTSCGCTTPEWTKEPIPPKEKGYVRISYDPKGRVNPFDKTITVVVTGGEPSQVTLRIKGEVVQ